MRKHEANATILLGRKQSDSESHKNELFLFERSADAPF